MATCAALVGSDLPHDAAEDSYNILPVLLGEQPEDQPMRKHTLHQTSCLALSIRKELWKYLDHQGSGGDDYEETEALRRYVLPDKAPDAPGQLYNLDKEPGETTNLYFRDLSKPPPPETWFSKKSMFAGFFYARLRK